MKSFRYLIALGALAALFLVPAGASAAAPQIATNYHQSCVLSDAGSVLCSGDNGKLALGDATSGIRSAFAAGPALGSVVQLATGENHVCALLADTTFKCWGSNDSYQLGQGGVDKTNSATPLTVKDSLDQPLSGVTQIATQDDTTCARKSDGTAWCWGAGTSGQLGDGGSTDLSLATQVFGLSGVVKVVPGSSVTCAIVTGGTVKCWGADTNGSLGNGPSGNSPTPVDLPDLSGVVDIGAGSEFSCALIADGTVKCWGTDGNGEQGNGPGTSPNESPATVPGLTAVTQLAVGYSTVCVLRADSTVFCWGYNDDYETGTAPASKVEVQAQNTGEAGAIGLAQQRVETG
jgi:alpha-tubulin suppressor-like RCC1 family protein